MFEFLSKLGKKRKNSDTDDDYFMTRENKEKLLSDMLIRPGKCKCGSIKVDSKISMKTDTSEFMIWVECDKCGNMSHGFNCSTDAIRDWNSTNTIL